MSTPSKKEEPNAPFWKKYLPRHLEHKHWKRDEHGHPIFHDDGVCTRCGKPAVKFSTPWHKFKSQIVGYCEPCITATMGEAPDLTEPKPIAKYKVTFRVEPMLVDLGGVTELEQLS